MSNISPGPVEPNPGSVVPALRFREALAAVRPELEQLEPSDYYPINIDIPSAVITALGCAPEMRALQSQVETLPGFDAGQFARIETYALAVSQAHTQFQAASEPAVPIQELADELKATREVLVSDVTALAKRKLLDGSRLDQLKGPNGAKNIAFDVMLLIAILRDNWATIGSKTAVQVSELDHAERTADRLATALGMKEQGPSVASEVSATRNGAYTLFIKAYDQARRAVAFLRWEQGDADTIAPSLYAGRVRKPSASEVVTPPTPPLPAPGEPTQPGAPPGPMPVISPTMPGNGPFVR